MEATPICQAWLRPDGGKGIRNKVLVLYTVECSKHVAESIAAHFQAQHRDVDVTGPLACLDNQAVVQRMLAYCVHPNVGAVLIVGHGCEYIEPDRIRVDDLQAALLQLQRGQNARHPAADHGHVRVRFAVKRRPRRPLACFLPDRLHTLRLPFVFAM